MTREQPIDQEARDLWQALKGGMPPESLSGCSLLDVLVASSGVAAYERLHSPFLRDSQISRPAAR